ncbi:hypothetical protein ACNF42_07735 [Cuniculiplasma sp. SKW3]|uniref:hypothetical protein n=1 Tax=unclassified Cuniculiplasma TaxID=2619706 RepID=UPI003FD03830
MKSKEIIMKREIESMRYECLATVRVKVEAPYISTVLKLAEKSGILTEEEISEELLPGESPAMANNIVKRYKQLGFIDNDGKLTELGKRAVKGDVFMPERGPYYIDVTEDPLIKSNFLQISYKIREHRENKGSSQNEGEQEKMMDAPNVLSRCTGKLSMVWYNGENREVLIEQIDKKVKLIKNDEKYLCQVTVGKEGSVMELKNKTLKISKSITDTVKYEQVWESFKEKNDLDWKGGPLDQGYCLVKYGETDRNQRKSFIKTLPKSGLEIENLGNFSIDPVDMEIQPGSESDASKWALELIQLGIKDFLDKNGYEKICESISSKFKSYKPKVPDIDSFIAYLYDLEGTSQELIPPEYWFLRAPLDLTDEVY